jgi:hypothetical protein
MEEKRIIKIGGGEKRVKMERTRIVFPFVCQ